MQFLSLDYGTAHEKFSLSLCPVTVEIPVAMNKLGDAHSLGPLRARPSPRHAELAANLSGAMATFLVPTWDVRKQESSAA
ncbi:abortive infection family protein [Caballeronia novacaledonica]|uniref:abortive infection family protein n=1 Tax=Caballeronia novacaledonica TaxID=1544861 RepID=UPI001FECBE97|nr:abortive infection family protein [Caballeronia novacaledonica]